MRMKLALHRFDKNWKLLEKREMWSRSFTRGLIELLYNQCTQGTIAIPVSSVDMDMVTRLIDMEMVDGGNTLVHAHHNNLRVSSHAGLAWQLGFSLNNSNQQPVSGSELRAYVTGMDLGIQVGTGNTAVTPTDRRLYQRIGHGRRAADGGDVTFESYTVNDDGDQVMDAANDWCAQEFIPSVSHRIYSVDLKIFKTGNPGDLTVSIKGIYNAVSVFEVPITSVCADLSSGTILQAAIPAASPGALTNCVLTTPIDVYAGRRYCIVARALGSSPGNSVTWRRDAVGATYQRAFCPSGALTSRLVSTDGGASYVRTEGSAYMFQENGRSVGEFEMGGTDLDNIAFADPNGSFEIKRFFTNHSGGAISVAEVGLHALAHKNQANNATGSMAAYPFLIARDVVGPAVNVLDTEILLGTYTPSITV